LQGNGDGETPECDVAAPLQWLLGQLTINDERGNS
jgi:hypothetical protein